MSATESTKHLLAQVEPTRWRPVRAGLEDEAPWREDSETLEQTAIPQAFPHVSHSVSKQRPCLAFSMTVN